jgi:hypothetical protein
MATSRGKNNKRQQPSTAGLPIKQVNAMEQKGMPSNQIIQELKKQGYTSSQIYYAMNQVNLGGGNVRVRQPLGFHAQQQNSPSKQQYPYTQQQVPVNKNHKKLFLIIIFVIIISIIVIAILPIFEKRSDVSQTEADSGFQSKVKDITDYDWVSFLNADGSENAKITALLFLANEIDALDDDFNLINVYAELDKSELSSTLTETDTSKENLLKLIENTKAIETIFAEEGLGTARVRVERLSVIENFFKKYPLPEGEINRDAKKIFTKNLGLTADDYSTVISLMIVNYNLFLAE